MIETPAPSGGEWVKYSTELKGIVHFEINVWYVTSRASKIVGVFVSAVVSILIFLGQNLMFFQTCMSFFLMIEKT